MHSEPAYNWKMIRDASSWKLAGVGFALALTIIAAVLTWSSREAEWDGAGEPAVDALAEEPVYPHLIPSRSTLYNVLREMNVSPSTIHEIVTGAKPVMDLGKLHAGTQFRLVRLTDPSSDLIGIEFLLSPIEKIEVKKVDGVWSAEKIVGTVESKVVHFQGSVKSTLWESAEEARMDPILIVQLAEIFAWQVDMAREVRVNDRWRLSVERKFVRGRPIGWGSILAAEYENAGRAFTAVLYQAGNTSGYYAADGSSLRRMFLKSPIRYGRISSRFQMRRFHPVLKIHRPHLGVDYAAPTGTPIRSVGDGTVTHAGWLGGGGRTIKVRHNSSYQTHYLHLSRIEKGIRNGVRIQQGQTIGYVGSTGLASGPHLHFEFVYNGKVVDPLGQKFPTAEPVPPAQLSDFQTLAQQTLSALPGWSGLTPGHPTRNPTQERSDWIMLRKVTAEAWADPLSVEP